MKQIFRSFLPAFSLLFIVAASVTGQPNPIVLTSGSGTWYPPAGCTSFYVQTWGGGAGGNNNYGGGGGSFSQSSLFTVTASSYTTGYSYQVGTGGGANTDGQDTKFELCWAYRGLANNQPSQRYINAGIIAASYLGGGGGSSYLDAFDRYGGGGSGSAYTNGSGGNGTNGLPFTYGNGGSGTGNGGNANGGSGGTPGGGGAGNNGSGARGEIRIFWTCGNYSPGQIEGAHTVPNPAEITAGQDFITNKISATQNLGLSYSWEDSSAAHNWTITGAAGASFAIPALEQDTWYRRVVNGCKPNKADSVSNTVRIKVIREGSPGKNGRIDGRVVSKNGVGVDGITITATKNMALKGSPQNYPYTIATTNGGYFTLSNLYYGDADNLDNPDNSPVGFTITATKTGHYITPSSISINPALSFGSPSSTSGNTFTDTTVYSISGKVEQAACAACSTGFKGPYNMGNVTITGATFPKATDSLNALTYGQYSVTVDNIGSYTLTPSYLNHSFTPNSSNFSVTTNVTGKNFIDNTTRTISGKLTDVSGRYIGYGKLLFESFNKRGNEMDPTFKAEVDIAQNTGQYTVTLPASKYWKVTVKSFQTDIATNDEKYISAADVIDFFKVNAVEPYIENDTVNTVRNLVYHRKPVIILSGLTDSICNTNDNTKNPGVVFRSGVPKAYIVNVYEGPASLGDKVITSNPQIVPDNNAHPLGDFIRFFTNVTNMNTTGNADTTRVRLNTGTSEQMLKSYFIPGAPNITAPFLKKFEVHYIDRFGRKADTIQKKATVTGVFNPAKTFTTAFPEKPYLILHEPPGDQSYSYWSKDVSYTRTTSYSIAKDTLNDEFANFSLGPKVSITAGVVSLEAGIIANLNYSLKHTKSTLTTDEEVISTTTNTTFQTNKSDVVTGTSGDVYIGGGMNYLLGMSKFVGFDETKENGNCEVIFSEKPIMSPESFRTEFAYREDHIVNVIIPQQQEIADNAPTATERIRALNQIDLWQQIIDKNTLAKKNADFMTNRSFSNGVSINESLTTSRTKSKTLSYSVIIDSSLAYELGLTYGGLGASAGVNVNIVETTSKDTVISNAESITMGYWLEDNDIGDYYSVDIKRDREHGTPVFDLVAGTSSCPPEMGAQNRDRPQIISGDMRFNNLNPLDTFFFAMTLVNKSDSREARYCVLSSDSYTGSGLEIYLDAKDLTDGKAILLPYNTSKEVEIKVIKSNPQGKQLSYPGVEFYLTDNCNGPFVPNSSNTVNISFNYKSNCGNIALAAPAQNFVVNSSSANNLPVTMRSYTRDNIDRVTLQYSKIGTKVWDDGFEILKAGITSENSYTHNWNISSLKDSAYDIRLKLLCLNGDILYSDEITGIIDRSAPKLLGRPQPVSGLYKQGADALSFNYNEAISSANIAANVELRRRSTNTAIPISLSVFDNKLLITPTGDLGGALDSFRIIVRNATDLYGNVKTTPDTLLFKLDPAPLITYTGSNVATAYLVKNVLAENSSDSMELHFRLRYKANKVTRIYFNLSGSATRDLDYTIRYDTILQKKCATQACNSFIYAPAYNDFGNSPGYIYIDSNKSEAIIYLKPLRDAENEGTENIRVDLLIGGEYKLNDSTSAEGFILNVVSDCPPGNIMYVNKSATGANNGTSWANAFKSLQDALAKKAAGCPVSQIWVAKGTYYPDEGVGINNNDRSASFVLNGGQNFGGFAIHGGFQGNEPPDFSLANRNLFANLTVLSGDIDNNTQPDVVTGTGSTLSITGNSGNSYHVIKSLYQGPENVPNITGFTITGGNANGAGEDAKGGGVYNNSKPLNLRNCILTGNQSSGGGGAFYNYGSYFSVQDCNFNDNKSDFGGAVSSYPLGGLLTSNLIAGCTFNGNVGTSTGGALYIQADPFSPGSMFNCNSSIFTNNYSFKAGVNDGSGGAAYIENHNGYPAYFTNCLFNGNKALGTGNEGGGALMSYNGPTTVANCTFVNNQAVNGGAMRIYQNSGKFVVKNAIFWANNATTGADLITGGNYEVDYSLLQAASCPAGATCGSGNLFNVNPLFADAAAGNYRLSTCSPAVDAGNDADNSTTIDLAGVSRKIDFLPNAAKIDMGAYELPLGGNVNGVLYVNAFAATGGNGSSWATALQSLQTAISMSNCAVQQIWVAKGTYKPTTNTNRDSAFVMKNNLAIYGGFAGTETLLSQRNWVTNKTILSGDIGVLNNSSDNSYNVVRNDNNGLNNTAILDGFTITAGNASSLAYVGSVGGAIFNRGGSAVYRNCMLIGNQARVYAGGFFSETGSPLLINSVLAGNMAPTGAGAYNESATTNIINCTFAGNVASGNGGGFYSYGFAVANLRNCIMWGNSSGMGFWNINSTAPSVSNSLVQGGFAGTAIITTDPLFITTATPGLGNAGDLRLRPCSPAINAGSNAALPGGITLDVAGNTRIVQTTVDIGAYERQLTGTIVYVDSASKGNNDGTSWANAYTSINDAVNDLNYCANTTFATSIYIAKGTYNLTVSDPSIINRTGAILLGGYSSGGGVWNPSVNKVIIVTNMKVMKSAQINGVTIKKPPAP